MMPLKDHPYHQKTNAELRYIINDAGQAALCFRGYNKQAEDKYTDQMLDACTILYWRNRK